MMQESLPSRSRKPTARNRLANSAQPGVGARTAGKGRFEPLARGRGRSMISTGPEWLHRVASRHSQRSWRADHIKRGFSWKGKSSAPFVAAMQSPNVPHPGTLPASPGERACGHTARDYRAAGSPGRAREDRGKSCRRSSPGAGRRPSCRSRRPADRWVCPIPSHRGRRGNLPYTPPRLAWPSHCPGQPFAVRPDTDVPSSDVRRADGSPEIRPFRASRRQQQEKSRARSKEGVRHRHA